MTDLDELIREVLTTDAQTQLQPDGLTERSMRLGQRLRHRRRLGLAAAALGSVTALVAGSLVIADHVGGHPSNVATVSTADQPQTPWWTAWPKGRVYSAAPGAEFMTAPPLDTSKIYASGTLPDGTDFVAYLDPSESDPHQPQFLQGWNDIVDFGEAAGEGPQAGPDATYLSLESPTYQTGRDNVGTTQWLVVVGQPGTTSASYSADGSTWQPMAVDDGIAVLQIPGIAPRGARIQLSDASGEYMNGPLALP